MTADAAARHEYLECTIERRALGSLKWEATSCCTTHIDSAFALLDQQRHSPDASRFAFRMVWEFEQRGPNGETISQKSRAPE